MSYPVCHSVLSSRALIESVDKNYNINKVTSLQFHQAGLNDTYLVKTNTHTYILRAYRKQWRTESDIRCELNLINHLQKNKLSVASAILNKKQDYLMPINAPEGLRFLVLFNYAEGTVPIFTDRFNQHAMIYGREFGRLHHCLKTFSSSHHRFELKLSHLLDEPLESICQFFKPRTKDLDYLIQLSTRLKNSLQHNLTDNLQMGFCHGDLNTENAHIHNAQLTFFDFDCCGYGYYAADLAAFLWGIKTNERLNKNRDALWRCFIQAYSSKNKLNNADIQSIPIFVMMRHIWHIGLHIQLSEDRGGHWLDAEYFDTQICLLKKWEMEFFDCNAFQLTGRS